MGSSGCPLGARAALGQVEGEVVVELPPARVLPALTAHEAVLQHGAEVERRRAQRALGAASRLREKPREPVVSEQRADEKMIGVRVRVGRARRTVGVVGERRLSSAWSRSSSSVRNSCASC